MISLHRAHALPWGALEQAVKARKKMGSASEAAQKNTAFFAHALIQEISEFSKTESAKYTLTKVKDSDVIFTPEFARNVPFADALSTLDQWKRWFAGSRKGAIEGGEAADVIKDLFNQDMMTPLLLLARNIPQLKELTTIAYSNFFHYGFSRVLEDAMACYLGINYVALLNLVSTPDLWPSLINDLTQSHDHDANLNVYRRLLKDYKKQPLPDETIRELQKFSFRCLYQYNVFWNEICAHSDATPIDWNEEVAACIRGLSQ